MTALRSLRSSHLMAMLATLSLGLSTGLAAGAVDREACESVKKQIRQIEAKMRNGYTAAQGIRYEERLRKLKEKRYKVCR